MAQLPIRRPSLPGRPTGRVPALLIAPPHALIGLAALIRQRLHTTLQSTLRTGLHGVARLGRADVTPRDQPAQPDEPTAQPDAVIVAAAAQFAPNAYARARLLRQMHAAGLLTQHETEQVEHMLGVAN